MRRPVVAGNWKMHGSRARIRALLAGMQALPVDRIDVVVFPPAPYLAEVVKAVGDNGIRVGAQNIHAAVEGAFTGEMSAEMVRDVGATWVLVGHSERRAGFAESDAVVAGKFAAAQRAGLIPVLCIGETLAQRESGAAERVVLSQIDAVIDAVGARAFRSALVAYEPVWAIGTGRTAAPSDAQAMHAVIRQRIVARDAETGSDLRVLYGGSVNGDNAAELFAQADVDGGLVGGASLDAREFARICSAA